MKIFCVRQCKQCRLPKDAQALKDFYLASRKSSLAIEKLRKDNLTKWSQMMVPLADSYYKNKMLYFS